MDNEILARHFLMDIFLVRSENMANLTALFAFCRDDDICSVWIKCIMQYGEVQCAEREDICENSLPDSLTQLR